MQKQLCEKCPSCFPHLYSLIVKKIQDVAVYSLWICCYYCTSLQSEYYLNYPLYFFKLSPFYLFSVIAYDSNCYVSVLVFSYFSLILSIWENAKHNSKSVSHQIRSQDDKLYCVCEDSCSRLCISAKKHNHFHFENLLYTSSYFETNRHIVLTVIKVL